MDGENNKTDNEVIEVSTDSGNLNPTNSNLVRVMDSIDNLGENFKDGITEYVRFKAEEEDKARQHESEMAKSGSIVSLSIVGAFILMWIISMLLGEKEMASNILQILLAIAAGAGATTYLISK